MAFSDAEATRIRVYLGFPDLFQYRNPRFEGALEVIGNDAAASAEVVAILDKLSAIETALDTNAIDVAGLSSVGEGDPEFYKGQTITDLRRMGRNLCGRLSIRFGVPLQGDYFSEAGYQGDAWMGRGFQGGGFFF